MTQRELIMFICLALMLAGLLLGFKWDGPGAFCILTGFVFFAYLERGFPGGWVFPLILGDGILYLVSFIISPRAPEEGDRNGKR